METKPHYGGKLGNSKIIVVKKKTQQPQPPGFIISKQPASFYQTTGLAPATAVSSLYQSHSQQRAVIDEFQNSLIPQNSQNVLASTVKLTNAPLVQNSRSMTPLKNQQVSSNLKLNLEGTLGQSALNGTVVSTASNSSGLNTFQMININSKVSQPFDTQNKNPNIQGNQYSMGGSAVAPHATKQVLFSDMTSSMMGQGSAASGINLINFKQQKINSRESSLEKIEENRQLNSKR